MPIALGYVGTQGQPGPYRYTYSNPDPNATPTTVSVARTSNPAYDVLSATKSVPAAQANADAMAATEDLRRSYQNPLGDFGAQSETLLKSLRDQLSSDKGAYDLSGTRSEIAAANRKYERAAKATAENAYGGALRGLYSGQIARGSTGLSGDLLNRMASAYQTAMQPVHADIATREANQAFQLKQMELANVGRPQAQTAQYLQLVQQVRLLPIESRARFLSSLDPLLSNALQRDLANTFYGVEGSYTPNSPTLPTYPYYNPNPAVARLIA